MSAQQSTLAQLITGLQTEVANNTTVEGSALTLIQGLAAQLAAALAMEAGPAQSSALQAVLTQLQTNDSGLAAAVAANTPAAPAAPNPTAA